MPRPLLITRDPGLAEEVSRLAAVTGCELERGDPDNPARGWQTAPAVVMDAASAIVVAALGLRRRSSVFVLCHEPTAELWRAAFEIGAERTIELPAEEADLVDALAEMMHADTPRSGRVLAIVGGCGGAGASVLAAATALASAGRGERCLLLDCDPLGGGLDLTVGTEADSGLRWSGLSVSGGRVAAGALRDALPGRDIGPGAITMLSCDRDAPSSGMTPQAVRAVLDAGRRAGETVVCDLPRAISEATATAVRLADHIVVLVPAEVRACAAARRLLAELKDASAGPVSIVVRAVPSAGLTVDDVAAAVGLDVLAVLRRQSGVATTVDRAGLWPGARGSLARAAHAVLATLDTVDTSAGESRVGDSFAGAEVGAR